MAKRVTLWERLPATAPLNKTAAKVTSQRGDHYDPDINYSGHWHSDVPPRLQRVSARGENLIGKKSGRLKVIGLFAGSKNGKPAKWVVRCTCGDYELRTARALKNPRNRNDKCPCSTWFRSGI